MTLLTDQQAQQVTDAIANVERRTDAELVTVLARQADDYRYIPLLWAALAALVSPGIVLFTPFWLSVAEVLLIQLGIFVLFALFLRIPPVLRRILPPSVKRWRASNMARRMFLENNLHHTIGETGLLIFVAETERYVEIIADRGINQYVDHEQWQSIVDAFTHSVHDGETLDGFLTAITRCGEILSEHVPATHDKDELPNHLIRL
jgi:putative membrane protein